MNFSSVGKKKAAAHVALLLVNIIVLVFATRINRFQEFFFAADLFPFALSIVTLVLLSSTIALDFAIENIITGWPQFEIAQFGTLSILWLAFNSFSTSRWRLIPFECDSIPLEFSDERGWCKDLQTLKAFIWVEFLMCFLIAALTLRYSITQHGRGNKHIWKMPLSRFRPELGSHTAFGHARDSEFLQFEKLT